MNDRDVDECISNHREAIEQKEMEEEQPFVTISRWWLVSTAFPLIAGTFGPMASAFSICALASPWRELSPPMDTAEAGIYIDDPAWLTGINASQLVLALVSNLFLYLNMSRRVRFSIAQPITITGWYISSFALVALAVTTAGPLRETTRPDFAFTQAFYYAVFSSGLYFAVASLMAITAYGAYTGHYNKEFNLTTIQRTLMLQTMSFLIYLLAGAAVYVRIENWSYLNAVYWADYTLLTVGLGDIVPTTNVGRGLLFPYATGGIIILGLVIASIRSLVLERGKIRIKGIVEKQRQRMIKRMQKKSKAGSINPVLEQSPTVPRLSRLSTPGPHYENGLTEHKFDLMRKVQGNAALRERWLSLLVSGFIWFILWFVGAAIFKASERSQGWTYFDSLYFSYTSLTTIGYGDYFPQSSSGRSFFVFWSLLAIPSLTVLISNMGDTVVKVIRNITLGIGEFTVLPGEKGVRVGVKRALYKVTGGKAFNTKVSETPLGILGESNNRQNDDTDRDHHHKNDLESVTQRVAGNQANIDVQKVERECKTKDKSVLESRRHYHCMLITEIQKVIRHLNSSPPRKYTFDEWAWYLKLIGKDESTSTTHRKAPLKPKADGEGLGGSATTNVNKDDEDFKWSWVGNRSPLIGDQEEAQWVLEKLTKVLDCELHAIREEELQSEKDRLESGEIKIVRQLSRGVYSNIENSVRS